MADYTNYGGASAELTQLLAGIPEPAQQSLGEFKETLNLGREQASREQMKSLAESVVLKDHSIPARDGYKIEARSYRPSSKPVDEKLPILVYYHGGGFLFGTLSSEDAACSRIAANVQCVVLNVNYRHTPEYTFPIAWNDSEDAFEWAFANSNEFHGDAQRIVVGGISAGAQLTAALVQTKKHEKAPSYGSIRGQILMIPCLIEESQHEKMYSRLKDPKASSWIENENAPILPVSRVKMFVKLLLPSGPPGSDDRRVNPGMAAAEEVKGLPPAVFGIAGLDPLRDEALLYAESLAENGIPTNVHLFKGVPHGFRRFGDKLSASKHWDEVFYTGITWALGQPKAEAKSEVHVH